MGNRRQNRDSVNWALGKRVPVVRIIMMSSFCFLNCLSNVMVTLNGCPRRMTSSAASSRPSSVVRSSVHSYLSVRCARVFSVMFNSIFSTCMTSLRSSQVSAGLGSGLSRKGVNYIYAYVLLPILFWVLWMYVVKICKDIIRKVCCVLNVGGVAVLKLC